MHTQLQRAIDEDRDNGYLRYHAPRYGRLLELLSRYAENAVRMLDIGSSPFTSIAQRTVGIPVDTLGFEADGQTTTGQHYRFDLNDAQISGRWRSDLPAYEIIVFSEVIEHLHTSPRPVLAFLATLLAPGGLLLLQTPNAVVAHKRAQLLLGRNPYSLISEDLSNPAHFREYTAVELRSYLEQAGFKVKEQSFENYFDYRYTDHSAQHFTAKRRYALVNAVYSILPGSFRPGLCFVAQR